MKDIKETLSSLREEINKYREDRGKSYISADVVAVEVAAGIVEFALKKNKSIEPNEEYWFEAAYPLAYSLDGTEWEKIYQYYKDLVTYVRAYAYFRGDVPNVDW